jgi:NAD(P)-dependent dehydrogenase (short-subunit alcohol dehydrogenase family)
MSLPEDSVALVTGASGDIGRTIAAALATRGVSLLLVGRKRERLEAAASWARQRSPRVEIEKADLTDDAALVAVADRLTSDFGRLDVLVHSAGSYGVGPVETTAVEEIDRQWRINVRVPYLLTQRLLPTLRHSGGQIVFVNSSVILSSRAGLAPYAATKHALRALADCLRHEVNPSGIRVLSVYPGRTATSMQRQIHRLEGKAYEPQRLLQPEDVAEAVVSALTLPRSAELTDLSIRPMKP